jgi:hypothetical protein
MEERYCLECEEALMGRADKKFCSDQCRNHYNNRVNSDNNNFMRNLNNILRRNRRILVDLAPGGKATMSKYKLQDEGYNFGYHTHIYTTRKGAVYYFCYEYGFIEHGNLVTIVQRKRTETLERENSTVAV